MRSSGRFRNGTGRETGKKGVADLTKVPESLKQQIEKLRVQRITHHEYVEKKQVLGLLADYEKEEENIRGALAETVTKLLTKIEYLEREILNMKEVEKESVCIPTKQLEELIKTRPKLFFDNNGKPKYIHGYISGTIEWFGKLDKLLGTETK